MHSMSKSVDLYGEIRHNKQIKDAVNILADIKTLQAN